MIHILTCLDTIETSNYTAATHTNTNTTFNNTENENKEDLPNFLSDRFINNS